MREILDLNEGWRFHKGEVSGAEVAGFDDSSWRKIRLPHDWSIEGPFDPQWASATGYLPGGVGWYRRILELPAEAKGRRVAVQFDGVYCLSDVWVNGQHVGRRPNGFISFEYNLTPFLNTAGPNILAVRVDHSRFADARWYTGSGINRRVRLVVTDAVRVAPWGVAVSMPEVRPEQATVEVRVTVQNNGPEALSVRVENVVEETQTASEITVAAGAEVSVVQSLGVPRPRLWSPDTPALYRLETRLLREDVEIDRQETPFGIRTIRFDADSGFFLNGQNLKLKGVCLHDDAGALGTAVPVRVWERRLATLQAAGVNAIRMAHNPHMPELYDLCDRMGLLVQDEAFDEWEGGKNKWIAGWNAGTPGKDGYHDDFTAWAETDLRDMVRRDRNHPSIIMWSIGNEVDYPNDPYTHEILETGDSPQSFGRGFQPDLPHADRLAAVGRRLAEVVRALDPTRPVTAALAAALVSNETGLADALDVVGYNYQEYRYGDDHARWPGRVLYGSENGMRLDFWRAVADNPFVAGQFLWTGIDYLGEAHGWPSRSNGAGLLDLAGLPKPEYFFRQSLWSATPMAFLGTRPVPTGDEAQGLWTHKRAVPIWSGTPGELVRVICFTNCRSATLSLNGQALGERRLDDATDRVLWWDVPYEPGVLSVHCLNDGDAIAASTTLRTAGPPAAVRAETDRNRLTADGEDLAHILVTVVDAAGVPVYAATDEITVEVDGPARLIGLESGDHTSYEDYQSNSRQAFHGRLLAYVQSDARSGSIRVRMSAAGLAETELLLDAGGE